MSDVVSCTHCGALAAWTAPFFTSLPAACTGCGRPFALKGEKSGAHFVLRRGLVVEVFWYEWDQDLVEEVRADLALLSEAHHSVPAWSRPPARQSSHVNVVPPAQTAIMIIDGVLPEKQVYDLKHGTVASQGNGHWVAEVEVVPLVVREAGAAARVAKAARDARLDPIARDLLGMMHGAPFTRRHLQLDRVDCVHPQEGGRVTPAFMMEYRRRAAVTHAWLERLLGEPVGACDSIYDVAERWDALGRPTGPPCGWDALAEVP